MTQVTWNHAGICLSYPTYDRTLPHGRLCSFCIRRMNIQFGRFVILTLATRWQQSINAFLRQSLFRCLEMGVISPMMIRWQFQASVSTLTWSVVVIVALISLSLTGCKSCCVGCRFLRTQRSHLLEQAAGKVVLPHVSLTAGVQLLRPMLLPGG